MLDSSDEILADINATLDQLNQNAKALKKAQTSHHFSHEITQLEMIQESLLARLLHRQSIAEMDKRDKVLRSIKREEVQRKVVEYARKGKTRRQRGTLLKKSKF